MKNLVFFFLFSFCLTVNAQEDTLIVPLKSIDSTIVQDVKYATADNFTKQVLYPSAVVFLRKIAAENLSKANKYLKENYNLRIKIYDGFRPLFVQKIMWKILPDERYVANPEKGSRHNRGAAVDITLIDEIGNELDMGTPYDDFTERASFASKDVSEKAYSNRKLLRETMIKFGFIPLESEWWHFDFKDWKNFGILDTGIN